MRISHLRTHFSASQLLYQGRCAGWDVVRHRLDQRNSEELLLEQLRNHFILG